MSTTHSDTTDQQQSTGNVPTRIRNVIRSRDVITGGLYLYTVLLVLFLWLPLAVVVFLSFAKNTDAVFPFQGFTLVHFASTALNRRLLMSAFTSIQVATVSASLATVLGVLASFGIVRYDIPGKNLFVTVGILPLIIPGVVFGASFFIFFNTLLGDSTGFIPLVVAHSAYGFPFVMLAVVSRLYTFDESLEECARDLGATTIQTFREITFPIIRPAIAAGFLFAFIRSFEDFIRALFISGTVDVITIEMFSLIDQGGATPMNVVSTVILAVVALLLLVAMSIGNVVDHVAK